MSDWQAGDLALAIADGKPCGECGHCDPHTSAGTIHEVARYDRFDFDDGPQWVLFFNGIPDVVETETCVHHGFSTYRFRKVTPPAADEFDRETIALMNGIRVGEPA